MLSLPEVVSTVKEMGCVSMGVESSVVGRTMVDEIVLEVVDIVVFNADDD